MNGDWPLVLLSALTVNHDARRVPVKEADRKKGPYPYYGASGIVDYVDDYIFEGEHLLVAEDGENLRTRQTPVAFMASGRFWVNNHAHIITGNAHALTRFIHYALQCTDISPYLTGAVMPKLTQRNLNQIEIPAPPLAQQGRIVDLLGSLDDKIELNRRMARTLEEMARALFRSWFIDFDPVRAKMEGRDTALPADAADLFPNRFGDDDLPEGWELKRLDAFAHQHREMIAPGDFPDEMFAHLSIPAFDTGQAPAPDLGASIKSQKLLVAPGLLLVSKLNPDTPRIWLVPDTAARAVASTEFVGLRPAKRCSTLAWLWGLTTSQAFRDTMAGMVTGTSKSHQRVQPPAMLATQWPFPGWPLVEAFDAVTAPILARAQACREESRTLAALRDTLLPKLISGELRIPHVEALVEEAA